MRVGISGDEGQPVIVPRGQCHLQAVVVRLIDIAHLVDEAEKGKLRVEGAAGLLVVRRVQRWYVLVNVMDAHQLPSVRAHICRFKRQVGGERVLDIDVPALPAIPQLWICRVGSPSNKLPDCGTPAK
jgi:hypothetical protein